MRNGICALFIATLILAGCGTHPAAPNESQALTRARATSIDTGVRAFMQTVAQGVSQNGPSAWRTYFADSPSFFMASDGRLVYADSAAATAGIHDLAASIKQIQLTWGDDLRVDPLAPNLAVAAATYHELLVDTSGKTVNETGYFTGTAEFQGGHWQFRDAHWSAVPPPPAPVHQPSTRGKARASHHAKKRRKRQAAN